MLAVASAEPPDPLACALYVDMGTTNTRVWLTFGERVLSREQTMAGVRDTARDGSPARIRSALRDMIALLRAQHAAAQPSCIVAAGMITSPLGLAEVPHIPAPAGLRQLAAAVRRHRFDDIADLPVLLVPGVRCGPSRYDVADVAGADMMRGEETLCVGLIAGGQLAAGSTLLNLGSHWKAISIDAGGRIAGSVTSLSGELIHAAQTQTILASSVSAGRPETFDQEWFDAGVREQRRSGLARALFCVRLLDQSGQATADQRLAFLTGAFVGADLDALVKRQVLQISRPVVIAGAAALARAWRSALATASIRATALAEEDVERGLLKGLRCIAIARLKAEKDKG